MWLTDTLCQQNFSNAAKPRISLERIGQLANWYCNLVQSLLYRHFANEHARSSYVFESSVLNLLSGMSASARCTCTYNMILLLYLTFSWRGGRTAVVS